MDVMLSTGDAAKVLQTSASRVARAVRSGLVPGERRGNRTLVSHDAVTSLASLWGLAPRHRELTRQELFVLTVLRLRPLGVRSAGAVARAAGVSPATAARALLRLQQAGLVERAALVLPGRRSGGARVWRARIDAGPWQQVEPLLRRVVLPGRAGQTGGLDAVRARVAGIHSAAAEKVRPAPPPPPPPPPPHTPPEGRGAVRDAVAAVTRVLTGRATLRDYFDLESLDGSGVPVEVALAAVIRRSAAADPTGIADRVVRALGDLDGVPEDASLPVTRADVATYWARRLPEVVSHLGIG